MIRRVFKRASKPEITRRKRIIESAKEVNIDLTLFDAKAKNSESKRRLQRQALLYISKGKAVPKRIKNAIIANATR